MNIITNQNKQTRAWLKILITLVCALLVSIIISIIIGIVYGIIAMVKDPTILDDLMTNNNITSSPIADFILTTLSELGFIFMPILFWKVFERNSIKNMGLTSIKKGYISLLNGLFLGFISMTLIFIVLLTTNQITMVNSLSSLNLSSELLTGFIIMIFVGFGEEILFRGYIMTVLKQSKNIYVIFIVSSVIFGLVHMTNPNASLLGIVNIILVGLLFAYMYYKTSNIWLPIGYHITWNYFQGYIFDFNVSGTSRTGLFSINYVSKNLFNGGDFGPEGGIITTVMIILAFLYVKFLCKEDKSMFDSDSADTFFIEES